MSSLLLKHLLSTYLYKTLNVDPFDDLPFFDKYLSLLVHITNIEQSKGLHTHFQVVSKELNKRAKTICNCLDLIKK